MYQLFKKLNSTILFFLLYCNLIYKKFILNFKFSRLFIWLN